MTPAAWDVVADDTSAITDRLPVPGGWLYRTTYFSQDGTGDTQAVAMVFVPDAEAGR